jgi:hypothetical protein
LEVDNSGKVKQGVAALWAARTPNLALNQANLAWATAAINKTVGI